MKVPCLCINNKNRPIEVLPQNWINEGTEYTINHIYYHSTQGVQGVLLDEVQTRSDKYASYRLNRFAFRKEDLEKLISLLRDCTELNDVDINKLIEESQLEVIKE